MPKLPFSKRNKPAPDKFAYDIPSHVRNRILYAIGDLSEQTMGSVEGLLESLMRRCQAEYGGLHRTQYATHHLSHMEHHWQVCDTDQFLDLLEWCFQTNHFFGGQHAVDAFNDIFRAEGIGYELSPYVIVTEPVTNRYGGQSTRTHVESFPEVTRKSHEAIHTSVVMPTLELLGGKRWTAANEEMKKAHKHLRDGNYREAINMAGCCLESVLKIICDRKGWQFKPDKDALSKLLQSAHGGGLFPSP